MIVDSGIDIMLSMVSLFVPVIGGTYLFSLYNLYIGRKSDMHKLILLSINFLFLIAFIGALFNITDYNQVPLIILLVLILSIIILGIIGAFMYEPSQSENKEEKYATVTINFKRILKGIYMFVGSVFLVFMVYNIVTHDIKVINRIDYIEVDSDPLPAIMLSFTLDDESTLLIEGIYSDYNINDIKQLELYFDNSLMHSSPNVTGFLLEQEYNSAYIENIDEQPPQGYVLNYVFDYGFNTVEDIKSVDSIKIIITTSHDTYTYEYLNVDYSYGYENKTVPIWVQEDS